MSDNDIEAGANKLFSDPFLQPGRIEVRNRRRCPCRQSFHGAQPSYRCRQYFSDNLIAILREVRSLSELLFGMGKCRDDNGMPPAQMPDHVKRPNLPTTVRRVREAVADK